MRVYDSPRPGALTMILTYDVIEPGDVSRLSIGLETGRTHQIRAQLSHIGHPVLGDDKYGDRAFNKRHGAAYQRLWCAKSKVYDRRLRKPVLFLPRSFLRGTVLSFRKKRKNQRKVAYYAALLVHARQKQGGRETRRLPTCNRFLECLPPYFDISQAKFRKSIIFSDRLKS